MITVALASRGRPELLVRTVERMAATATLPETCIVVGLDEDDPEVRHLELPVSHVRVSLAPREDSLGAKYNRCAAVRPADLYIYATDDCTIITSGWDAMLTKAAAQSFPDGVGLLYFGSMQAAGLQSSLPSMQAITRGLVDRIGFVAPPYFPFWFHDTWLDEIGHMIGRIVAITNIEVAYPDQIEAKRTRAARDILFWARFFDETRGLRRAVAESVLGDPTFDVSTSERLRLLTDMTRICDALEQRNCVLRDPVHVTKLEGLVAFDAPDDARTRRIKAAAETMLKAIPAASAAA